MKKTKIIMLLCMVVVLITLTVLPCFAEDYGMTASQRWGYWQRYVDGFRQDDFNADFASQMVYIENNESWASDVTTTIVVNNQPNKTNAADGLLRYMNAFYFDRYHSWVWRLGEKVFTAFEFYFDDNNTMYRGVMGHVDVEKIDSQDGFYMWFYDDYQYNPNVARIRLRWRVYEQFSDYGQGVYRFDQIVVVGDDGTQTTYSEWENGFGVVKNCCMAFMHSSTVNQVNNAGVYIATALLGQGQSSTNGVNHLAMWVDNQELWAGVERGLTNGYNSGYSDGYEQGSIDGVVRNENAFLNMVTAIFTAPGAFIDGIFNFEIFGINLAGFIKTILTIAIVGAIIVIIWKVVR